MRARPVRFPRVVMLASTAVYLLLSPSAQAQSSQAPPGMVGVPSFDTPPRQPAKPPPALAPVPPVGAAAVPSMQGGNIGKGPESPTALSPGVESACRRGPDLEPREFTQPEVLGRPPGDRARMCFFRFEGNTAEYLNFFSSGHFYHTSISGSGGFAVAGAVYGTVRGNYGFQPGGILATRIGYQGTGVSQTSGGAGTQSTLEVSGQATLEREMTLPNCQKITYRDEVRRVQLGASSGHPSHLIVNGVRWEQYRIDCPTWSGWIKG